MREKNKILDDARQDIINPDYAGREPYWLEVRKIEVLLDIREALLGLDDRLSKRSQDEPH